MEPATKAALFEQGGKIIGDVLHFLIMRPRKRAPDEEWRRVEETPQPKKEAALTVTAPAPSKEAQAPLPKGTACKPCTSDHFSTCAGALSEALRFARSGKVSDYEVQRRISLCVDELNIWERIDVSPEVLPRMTPDEKVFVRKWLPRGRELRHDLNEITTLEDLEAVAAKTKIMALEARQDMAALQPPVMKQIQSLADEVKSGKITKEEALTRLKEWHTKSFPTERG